MCSLALAPPWVSADVATTKSSHILYPSGIVLLAAPRISPGSWHASLAFAICLPLRHGCSSICCGAPSNLECCVRELPVWTEMSSLFATCYSYWMAWWKFPCKFYTCTLLGLVVHSRQFKRYCCRSVQKTCYCCCLWFCSLLIYYGCLSHLFSIRPFTKPLHFSTI